MKRKHHEIRDYDSTDTTGWIDRSKTLSLKDLGFELPPCPPTQVVSIRLPTSLLNKLRALASAQDISYQMLVKVLLNRALKRAAFV